MVSMQKGQSFISKINSTCTEQPPCRSNAARQTQRLTVGLRWFLFIKNLTRCFICALTNEDALAAHVERISCADRRPFMGEGAAAAHTTHACKGRNARKRAHTSSFVMLNEIWLPPHDWLAHFRSLGGGDGGVGGGVKNKRSMRRGWGGGLNEELGMWVCGSEKWLIRNEFLWEEVNTHALQSDA